MIAGRLKARKGSDYHRCWEVLDNEYKNMNINCNADSGDDFKKYELKMSNIIVYLLQLLVILQLFLVLDFKFF